MLSNYILYHNFAWPEIHGWVDLAFYSGIIGVIVGLAYFIILRLFNWWNRKKEHDIFIEDITNEIKDLTNSPDKYFIEGSKIKDRTGNFGHFSLDTFNLFNNKYRYLFNKKLRDHIGELNIQIKLFNQHAVYINNLEGSILFYHEVKEREHHVMIRLYNAELKRIKEKAIQIERELENHNKPNLFNLIKDSVTRFSKK